MKVTSDLSEFGYIERKEASELLAAYQSNNDDTKYFHDDGVSVSFNTHSGFVFLTNHNFDVAMMSDGKLVDFMTCFECGNEGLLDDIKSWATNDCCLSYLQEIGEDLEDVN